MTPSHNPRIEQAITEIRDHLVGLIDDEGNARLPNTEQLRQILSALVEDNAKSAFDAGYTAGFGVGYERNPNLSCDDRWEQHMRQQAIISASRTP